MKELKTTACSLRKLNVNWNSAFGWGDHSTAGYLSTPSLTNNIIPKWDGSIFSDGLISDDGLSICVETIDPTGKFEIISTPIADEAALDQSQILHTSINGTPDHWQSFTSGISGLLTRIDVHTGDPSGSDLQPCRLPSMRVKEQTEM